MIGIFIGIAAVVSLMSLGQGLQDAINAQFEMLGKDKIIIQPTTFGPPGSATSKSLILSSENLKGSVLSTCSLIWGITRGIFPATGLKQTNAIRMG